MQSNNKKPVVVGIGELLWDMLPTGKKAGGAPINFVYHASRLGAEGYAISAVGDDGLGREILEELDNNSIRYLIEKVPYPTGTVQVTLQDGVPDYIINERVAWDHLSPTSNAIDLAERGGCHLLRYVRTAFRTVERDDTSDSFFCPGRCLSLF